LKYKTSEYNRGGFPIRVRDDETGKAKRFELNGPATVYDGVPRPIGTTRVGAVLLNDGAVKRMDPEGRGAELHYWAWRSGAGGSGWIPQSAFVHPPRFDKDPHGRNPRPPALSDHPLIIDAEHGRRQLAGLRFLTSKGEFPARGGNSGDHYGGRKKGSRDYIYLLFAAPNVARGGAAKDSLANGSEFFQALDERGRPIREAMTMYEGKNLNAPVRVTFVYGRGPRSRRYGWIARANVGRR
jgi:hypothetical protein